MKKSRFTLRKIYSGDKIIELCGKTFTLSSNSSLNKSQAAEFAKKLLRKNETAIRITQSICPECAEKKEFNSMLVPCLIFEKDNLILLRKRCGKHGLIEDKYWEDAKLFGKAMHFADNGIRLEETRESKSEGNIVCPLDCGLCLKHKSHTSLANIAVTNRCNLSCWYCFFYQKKHEPVFEPSLNEIRGMLKMLKKQKPVCPKAIQLTGGEPAIRSDILKIIKACKEEGFEHVQFNTNGIRLARSKKFARDISAAGANLFYISFDGVTEKTNPKNHWEIPKALEHVRSARFSGVVLVPTVINDVNSGELGDIVRFAAANIDLVRGVNFQPVSLVGMMPRSQRKNRRITIPKTLKLIEEQTNRQIKKEDFYSVPCLAPLTDLIEAISGIPQYRFSTHFACGMATYVFIDGNRLVPMPRFFDVEGFLEYLESLSVEIRNSKLKNAKKFLAGSKLLYNIDSFIDREAQPTNLDFGKILSKAIINGSYDGFKDFHYKSLFLGLMHFQDLYNYDVDRTERCSIHYATPDGRIIPFCTYNVLPELYRDKINRKFSMPAGEWEQKNNRKLNEDKYKRNYTKSQKAKIEQYYKDLITRFS